MSGGNSPQHTSNDKYAESEMNMALLDPPRWGWSAVGGMRDLLAPHERARRKETKKAFLVASGVKRSKRGRPPRNNNDSSVKTSLKSPPPAENSSAQSTPQPVKGTTPSAAEILPRTEATAPTPQASATNDNKDDENKDKDNQQSKEVSKEEDSKPAAKESETQLANGDDHTATPGDAGKSSSQNLPAGATPKADTNDATPDVAMTDANKSSASEAQEKAAEAPQASSNGGTNPKANDAATKNDDTITDSKEITSTDENVFKIGALQEDGGLDVYAYHRGREGMEPRDAATGELLCDVDQTDTNYRWDEPKLALQVTVSFPLTTNSNESNPPMFEDTISWNLGDPETPTPMAFAIATAEEFGLTFCQTTDLALSIQQQLFGHSKDHCGYAEPVAITDGAGMDRTLIPPPTVCHIYGGVLSNVQPGTYAANAAPTSRSKSKRQSYGTQGSSSRRSLGSDDTGRGSNRPPPIEYYDEDPAEDIYIEEVKKRMIDFSRDDIARKCEESGQPRGRLQMMSNYVCHICHKRHHLVGKFSCGFQSHSYCATHLRNRLDLTVEGIHDELYFDYCPVCAVTCLCSKCGRRRDALGIQLKRKSQEQGVEPDSTVFEEMFTCFTKPQAAIRMAKQAAAVERKRQTMDHQPREEGSMSTVEEKKKSKPPPKSKSGRKPSIRDRDQVEAPPAVLVDAKPGPNVFPREIRGGVDVDPGSSIDYRTVYTAEGHFVKDVGSLPKQAKPKTSESPPPVQEDGNVDFCQACRMGGGMLLCCDYCPRAYHSNCMESDESPESSGTWECPGCKRIKQDLPEYTLSGSESQSKICAVFNELKATCDDDLTQLTILSKIHEMLEKLMAGDFGNTFAVPVDPSVPDYLKLIKKPMDLGTIASKLLNGGYLKCFEAHKAWSDVHLAVLKDIELVWNNCFTYNYEGSSFYKMAEDCRKRMVAMRARSLDNDLPDSVRHKLDEYVKTSRKERGKIPVPPHMDGRPRSRYKITIQSTKVGRSTKVAILDPDSGMVVKIYTTIKSAWQAANFLHSRLGYKPELNPFSEFSLKSYLKRATDNPLATLFGYRWLELDKLHAGQVRFSAEQQKPPASCVFEVKDGKSFHTFLSLDEAVTHRLSRGKHSEELRKALYKLRDGGEWVEIFDLQWRRRKFVADGKSLHQEVALSNFWEKNATQCMEKEEPLPAGTLVEKEDRILGRITGRFETLEAAYEDWEFACGSSPSVPADEITQSSFYTYYLNGDRNVDGVIYKISEPAVATADCEAESHSPTFVTNEEEKATTVEDSEKGDVVTDPMEVENQDVQVEPSVKNLPSTAPSSDNHVVNGSEVKPVLVPPPVNGIKRERSEEVLMPRKK